MLVFVNKQKLISFFYTDWHSHKKWHQRDHLGTGNLLIFHTTTPTSTMLATNTGTNLVVLPHHPAFWSTVVAACSSCNETKDTIS